MTIQTHIGGAPPPSALTTRLSGPAGTGTATGARDTGDPVTGARVWETAAGTGTGGGLGGLGGKVLDVSTSPSWYVLNPSVDSAKLSSNMASRLR